MQDKLVIYETERGQFKLDLKENVMQSEEVINSLKQVNDIEHEEINEVS